MTQLIQFFFKMETHTWKVDAFQFALDLSGAEILKNRTFFGAEMTKI